LPFQQEQEKMHATDAVDPTSCKLHKGREPPLQHSELLYFVPSDTEQLDFDFDNNNQNLHIAD